MEQGYQVNGEHGSEAGSGGGGGLALDLPSDLEGEEK